MTRTAVCIDAFAALTPDGFVTPDGTRGWQPEQNGPADVARADVLDSPLPAFGKLQLADKLAFSAAALMMKWYGQPLEQTTGVCVALPWGSLSTDLAYNATVKSPIPSPAIFSATLPSSPLSEITIFYHLKGPNRVFAGGDLDGVAALDESCRLVALGKAPAMVVVWTEAVATADATPPHANPGDSPCNQSCAVLVRPVPAHRLNRPVRVTLESGQFDGSSHSREYFSSLVQSLSGPDASQVHMSHPRCRALIEIGKTD